MADFAVAVDLRRAADLLLVERESSFLHRRLQGVQKGRFDRRQRHAVLRTLGAGQARFDGAQIEPQNLGVMRRRAGVMAIEMLLLGVAFDQIDFLLRAAGFAEIGERLAVDGEETHRRAVLGRHVRHQRAIGHFHVPDRGAEIFDELLDHAFGAENLRHGEHQIGGRRAGRQFAAKFETDHFGREQIERLAEHHGFGLDSADAPADHAQAVDHRGVAVGADERIGEGDRAGVVLAAEKRTSPDIPNSPDG